MLRRIRSGQALPRGLAAAFLACALLLRMAVPQGWMPVQAAHGIELVMCAGSGPAEMPMANASTHGHYRHKAPQKHGHDSADHPCTYAGLGQALDGPGGVTLPAPQPSTAHSPTGELAQSAIGRGLAAPPPPSTGPPIV